ncbi:MAG: hypothetical protein QGH39_07895 [Candidatus Thermoplasmatota archaeon]|nr:hypothetical protein [Candidatus Thermoplasmatota archaeon]MDP7265467.1 hypothetical protein [Candidatus Thermoplasmatota archaeon]
MTEVPSDGSPWEPKIIGFLCNQWSFFLCTIFCAGSPSQRKKFGKEEIRAHLLENWGSLRSFREAVE